MKIVGAAALIHRKRSQAGRLPEAIIQPGPGQEMGGRYQSLHLWKVAQDEMKDTLFINLDLPPRIVCVCVVWRECVCVQKNLTCLICYILVFC